MQLVYIILYKYDQLIQIYLELLLIISQWMQDCRTSGLQDYF